jgi:fructokinase
VRIGIDLGGTKIAGIALDRDGTEVAATRVSTPVGDYSAIVAEITSVVADLERLAGPADSVGVGHPGVISPAAGVIKNANSVVLNGRPLDVDLTGALGRPVRLANDADCFALSEATDGAGMGAATVFGVIIGTGVGGGLVVRGELVQGPNGIAGEWGHTGLPRPRPEEVPGPDCYCGLSGCVETYLSGPGLAADHRRAGGDGLTPEEIVAGAAAGADAAAATLGRYVDRLARGLAEVINVVDPHVIVLGGGMSNIDLLYEAVPDRWGRWIFSDRVDTVLARAHHGDAGGVRGAAWLWPATSS